MRLGKTTLVHFASQVAVSVSGFVATFAIARVEGADLLGVYAVAVALTFWLNVPASAVGNAVTKRVSEGTNRGEYVSAGLALNLAVGLVAGAGITVGLPLLARFEFLAGSAILAITPHSPLVGLLVVGNVAFITLVDVLEGQKLVARSGVLKAVERVVRTVVQVAVVIAGYAIVGLLVGHVAALAVGAVLGVLVSGVGPRSPSLREVRDLMSYARYSWLGGLKTRAFAWMDTIVLAFFVGQTLIGVYEVAWNLASLLALVSVSIRTTLFPEISDLSTSEDFERVRHYLNEGLAFTGVFVIPGLFGAAAIGRRVLKIYSPEFTVGIWILIVLVFARSLAAYGSQFLSAINAVDRPDVAFRINFAFVAVNVGLNVVLVWQFGWYGAAVATTVSAALMLVLAHRALVELVGHIDLPASEIARQVAAAGVMAVVIVALQPAVPRNHYVTVGLVFLGAGVYTAVLLILSVRVRTKVTAVVRDVAGGALGW